MASSFNIRKIRHIPSLFLEMLQKTFLRMGFIVRRIEDPKNIKHLINMCRPIDSGIDLVRIGGENDGGYLIPADLTGVDCCFSPGVSNSARFEEELEAKFGIKSHLADFSVPGPPHGFVPKSFDRKFISSYTKDNRLSFDDWIENCVPQQESRDLIMQVDIEGSEYEAILGLSQRNLDRFRIIAIEIHNIELWADKAFFQIAKSLIEKLTHNYSVVHFHPNNFADVVNIGGTKFPRVFELTLLRKDRITVESVFAKLPHLLDQRNSTERPEVYYNFSN